MKYILSIAWMAAFITVVHAQPSAPKLIVRGDDMGYTHSGNLALLKSYKEGVETSIEVIVPSPWFMEAVKMLDKNPGVDVGIHLALTSEWENIKWKPLTNGKSITDSNGYFYPMVNANKAYPHQSLSENNWKIEEVEKEFRAQIEMALKHIPRISHISSHMGCTNLTNETKALTQKLANEYGLVFDMAAYDVQPLRYDMQSNPSADHATGFAHALSKLEKGKTYLYVEHPGLDNEELQAVYHIGYENVANHRQRVTDVFTSGKVKDAIKENNIQLVSYNTVAHSLPRSTPEAEGISSKGIENYLAAVQKSGQDLHSLMIVRHGKVVAEKWLGDNAADKNHILNSVSKTFTATAIGFAVQEGRLKVTDKVVSFFPNELPATVSPNLAALEIKHLLTMSVGHSVDPTSEIRKDSSSWEKLFLATPISHQPGTKFVYNSLATYMLSAIIQKVTGQTVLNYLYPRLLRPLGITGAEWLNSPTGVNTGGWGLYVKTEDMAKMGQFLLQKGAWKGKQLLPTSWFDEATKAHITQPPVWVKEGADWKQSDWVQGYGYQVWRSRHNSYRADGANGQFILVLPEKDAVIVTTANIQDMQSEINLIWKHLLPAIK